jgi:hypothetical protein
VTVLKEEETGERTQEEEYGEGNKGEVGKVGVI